MLENIRTQLSKVQTQVSEGVSTAATTVSTTVGQAASTASGVALYVKQQASNVKRDEAIGAAREFAEGFALGDFSKNPSVAAQAGRTICGVLPGTGTIGALRDCAAHGARIAQGEKGATEALLFAAGGLLPWRSVKVCVSAAKSARSALGSAGKWKDLAETMATEARAKQASEAGPKRLEDTKA